VTRDLNFLCQALRLTNEVLGRSALIISVVELQNGLHGRFEVTLDGDLALSKAAVKRL
jgi:predicted Rdx family selenoprotein